MVKRKGTIPFISINIPAAPEYGLCMVLSSDFNKSNMTGATSEAVTAYPSGAIEFTPGFLWGSCYSIFCFMCMVCRSLFVLFLLAVVLSVLLQFTDSDYPFGIVKLFLYSYNLNLIRIYLWNVIDI